MLYTIEGYEHNAGYSQSKKRDYDIHIIHARSVRPMKGKDKAGHSVEQIVINESDGILTQIPALGETWEITFNRQGRVEDAYPVAASGDCCG